MNKLVAWGVLASLGVAFLAVFFEASVAYETYDNLIGLAGLGMWVFGIWAAVLLLRIKK